MTIGVMGIVYRPEQGGPLTLSSLLLSLGKAKQDGVVGGIGVTGVLGVI